MSSLFQWIRRAILGAKVSDASFKSDIQHQLAIIANVVTSPVGEERIRILEHLLIESAQRADRTETLVRVIEERSRALEELSRVVEQRSRTIEYLAHQSAFAYAYQIDFLQRFYVEIVQKIGSFKQKRSFNANSVLKLQTDYPIAFESNDHINPDSTTEGISRPTLFVQDCIRVLGTSIKTLDLGTGAAGIPLEFAMNDALAIGVDGSDFCRKNRIGYWPLLHNNLFTCDITKPFTFVDTNDQGQIKFDVITMWEVLEHLNEDSLYGLFQNITHHLNDRSYFIGSVSLVTYTDPQGNPYHVTLKPREWWRQRFEECGLEMITDHPFNEKFFPRGNGPRYQDFHNYAKHPEEGFLFVSKKRSTASY